MRITVRIRIMRENLMKFASVTIAKLKRPATVKPTADSSKQRLNVTVSASLIARARAHGLNLSGVLEEGLTERLRKAEAELWATENADAIAHYNARIERDGLWHKGMTPYY